MEHILDESIMQVEFPGRQMSTQLEWKDLIITPEVEGKLELVHTWLSNGNDLFEEWGLEKRIQAGYRCLFYGPPGTGKTLAASLIGKSTNREVWKVDFSQLQSSFIGETEKNISKLFEEAATNGWILFFDEADSLFGKRSEVKDAHENFANQEVSYLLQHIESYPGLLILASNFKDNLDGALRRRLDADIVFERPCKEDRLRLWKNIFQGNFTVSPDTNFADLADKHEISGGAIVNVLRHSVLKAASKNSKEIESSYIIEGIREELKKAN